MWLSLIAAMTMPDRIIGRNNQLPWHMPADMAYFKRTTLEKPILMGRKTFASLGRPLPRRQNIIITRDPQFSAPGCDVFHSLSDALLSLKHQQEVFVIGGEEIFKQTINIAKYLYLTFIYADIAGDTYFPEWHAHDWTEISRQHYQADSENPHEYSFVVLERNNIL